MKKNQVVYDHDFPSFATGIAIPHGIYDEKRNQAYLTIGASKDTSEFVCDSVEHWWDMELKQHYPQAEKLVIRCDGGGSTGSRHHIVKQDFQQLSIRLGLPIQIQHYPPYCSKYNRIEHRVFPHLTRQWNGVIFTNYEIVKELAERTTTQTGLMIKAVINLNAYQTGRKANPEFLDKMNIKYESVLGKWNYTFHPQLL